MNAQGGEARNSRRSSRTHATPTPSPRFETRIRILTYTKLCEARQLLGGRARARARMQKEAMIAHTLH